MLIVKQPEFAYGKINDTVSFKVEVVSDVSSESWKYISTLEWNDASELKWKEQDTIQYFWQIDTSGTGRNFENIAGAREDTLSVHITDESVFSALFRCTVRCGDDIKISDVAAIINTDSLAVREVENCICIYDKNNAQNDFNDNGIVILQPTSCVVNETLNGEYSVTMTHRIDTEGRWRQIRPFRIIKVLGQLFRIMRIKTNMSSDGTKSKNVYARHISYDLNDKGIDSLELINVSGSKYIEEVTKKSNWHYDGDFYPFYEFSASSDIAETSSFKIERKSPMAAILGTADSMANRYGGEIHRDNFRISVNHVKEGSTENAFYIRYGVDMQEVEESIDYTNFISDLQYYDSKTGLHGSIYWPQRDDLPHQFTKYVTFNYDKYNASALTQDGHAYFDKYCTPSTAYKVKFAQIEKLVGYEQFKVLQKCEVGDSGTIVNDDIDISTAQRVVRKQTDALTGTVISIELGNIPRSIVKKNEYTN